MAQPFPLAAVLRLREQAEAAEERALARIAAEVGQAREALRQMDARLAQHAQARAREQGTLLSPAHHQLTAAQWVLLRDARAGLLRSIEALEQRRMEQQQRYLASRQRRETLSSLQAAHAAESSKAELRQEQKRLDNLSGAHHARTHPAKRAG